MTDPADLGDQLRRIREAAGLTLQRAADRADISAACIGSWERGDRTPPVDRLTQYLALYGLTLTIGPSSPDQPTGESDG